MHCPRHPPRRVRRLIKPKAQGQSSDAQSKNDERSASDDNVIGTDGYDELLQGEYETLRDLQEIAVHEMDAYLDETFTRLELNEMDAVRKVVQGFRSLVVYFRKSPKALHRLARIQIDELNIPSHATRNLVADCPTRWDSCINMITRFADLNPPLRSFFEYLGTPAGRKEFKDVKR